MLPPAKKYFCKYFLTNLNLWKAQLQFDGRYSKMMLILALDSFVTFQNLIEQFTTKLDNITCSLAMLVSVSKQSSFATLGYINMQVNKFVRLLSWHPKFETPFITFLDQSALIANQTQLQQYSISYPLQSQVQFQNLSESFLTFLKMQTISISKLFGTQCFWSCHQVPRYRGPWQIQLLNMPHTVAHEKNRDFQAVTLQLVETVLKLC